jgi:predicted ATPase/DNA-binding CsgD family transcriptional regulator
MGSFNQSVLIGRRQELATLEEALTAARHRDGRCILISGEAGIGKSRLLAEIQEQAVNQGFSVLVGRCFVQDNTSPYAPLINLLRPLIKTLVVRDELVVLLQSLGPLASELVKLVPDLPQKINTSQILNLEAGNEKHRLFESLTNLFLDQAGIRPLVIIFEDLHWSDEATVEFLLYLLRRISDHPILLLLSRRQIQPSPALAEIMISLDRHPVNQDIQLWPLNRVEMTSLLRNLLDQSKVPPPYIVDPIFSLTEGNPYFVEEVLATLLAAGELPDDLSQRRHIELRIPQSIKRLVQQRLAGLSPIALRLVNLAAVSGRSFDFTILQALTGYSDDQLLELIKELVVARLAVEESADTFSFRHALTREALYDNLLIRERRNLHQQFATTIELQYADSPDSHLSDLAFHYYEAGQWAKALDYARQAGEQAQALFSPGAAVVQFSRAIDSAEKVNPNELWTLFRLRAQAVAVAGDFAGAQADFEAALAAARALPDETGEWQLLLDLARLWTERDDTRVGEYAQEALALAHRLDNKTAIAASLNQLGHWYLRTGRCEEALEPHQEALAILESLDEPQALADTLEYSATANSWCGNHEKAAVYYQKAVAILRKLDDRQRLASSLIFLNVLTLNESQVREAEEIAREIGWHGGQAFALAQLGNTLSLLGDYNEAASALERGLVIADEFAHLQRQNNLYAAAGFLYLRLLAPEPAQQYLQKGMALAQKMSSAFYIFTDAAYLASAFLLEGKVEEATELLSSMPRLPEQWGPILLVMRTAEMELALARGEAQRAMSMGEELRRLARQPEKMMGMVASTYSVFLRVFARALVGNGRYADAEEVLLTAHQKMERQNVRTELWRIKAGLGRVYQAAGRLEEAAACKSEAQQLIQQLAKYVPREELRRQFLSRAMAELEAERPLRSHTTGPEPYGGLTPRQLQVAGEVALGKTNVEIAESLNITVKTVETHISRIFSKLGFTSRTQVAVWAVEEKLRE